MKRQQAVVMESKNERLSTPGTERILEIFYDSEVNSSSTSVESSPKRRVPPHTNIKSLGRKDISHAKDDLISDKINDMHFAGDMIRRTVYNNQNAKVQKQGDSIATVSLVDKRTSHRQMKGLQHSQSMQTIIQEVMEVHNSVTGIISPHCQPSSFYIS